MQKIKLALADDEELFLNGLKAILEQEGSIEITGTAADGDDLIKQLENNAIQPDIVLLDLRMKKVDGVATTKHLKEKYSQIKIIILSSHYRESYLGYMFKLGVNAFLPKDIDPDLLKEVIVQVHHKGLHFTNDQLQSLHQQLSQGKKSKNLKVADCDELTGRETEILQLICEQFTNGEIAEKLFISIRTVEGHRNNLLLKTGARNTVGLVLFALAHKLVDWNAKLLEFGLR